jgi:hypothetical protein
VAETRNEPHGLSCEETMRTHILRVFLFSLITVAAASAGPAQRSNRSIDSDTPPPALVPPPPLDTLAIFDLAAIATDEPDSLLGVEVVAAHLRVDEIGDRGFWATAADGEERVFIVPAEGTLITVRPGEFVTVHGEVRLRPRPLGGQQSPSRTFRSVIPYVYAYTIRPAWPKERQPAAGKQS